MKFQIIINHFHPGLLLGLENIKSAWLLSDLKKPIELKPFIYQGNLYYRLPGSGKRISYRTLKKGLMKKRIIIPLETNLLPF